MMDDLPELLRPIRTVMGLNLTVTSSSKILKLESLSSASMKYPFTWGSHGGFRSPGRPLS